jgi:hypothetical protein
VSTEVQRTLFEQVQARVLEPGRRAGYELQLLGGTVLPQRQVIATTDHGKWLFVDHVDDPTAQRYKGKIPIPRDRHTKLVNLDQHYVDLHPAYQGVSVNGHPSFVELIASPSAVGGRRRRGLDVDRSRSIPAGATERPVTKIPASRMVLADRPMARPYFATAREAT